jgi:flavin reductase (DIM6/NTAB) family NADH-FMN oxidoreductase RutF
MARFASGVTVVTSMLDGLDHAMTANAFTAVSLDPPLVLVCVDKTTRFHQAVAVTRRWAVSILDADRIDTATWLADRGRPLSGQLDRVPHGRGHQTGAALVDGALAWVECRTWELYDGGDHSIVVGLVLDLGIDEDRPPLTYFQSSFWSGLGARLH